MTTEILGFIIILGAVIVLLARQHLNKSEDDPEVLEAGAGRLRYELEQSADEIINRMTEHIDRLERMLREADYKSELLQQKINMLQAMGYTDTAMPQQNPQYNGEYAQGRPQMPAANNFAETQPASGTYYADMPQMPPVSPVENQAANMPYQDGVPSYAEAPSANMPYQDGSSQMPGSADVQEAGVPYQEMPQTAPNVAEQGPAAVYTASAAVPAQDDAAAAPANTAGAAYEMKMTPTEEKAWELVREASMKLEAQYEAQANTMQSVQQSDALQQAVDIQSGNIEGLVSASINANPQQREAVDSGVQALPEEAQGLDTEEATKNAREMIAAGHDLEEIARATGLGIGAVHLIKQLQEMKKET